MKKKRWMTGVIILAFTLMVCGCKKHVLDGPGMVNNQPWKAFTLSRSDSYSQYNFWFTVQQGDFSFLLTGECRDEDGEMYTIDDGVELSSEDLQFLRDLWLGELPDAVPGDDGDELIILDAPTITLVLTWMDNTEQEKVLSHDISIQIYQRFLPYFKHN